MEPVFNLPQRRTWRKRGLSCLFVILAALPGWSADVLLEVPDARTQPPVILENPGAEFQDEARPGAMIIGMDRTPRGRIWGCWTGTGDKPDGYFLLATSDDGGQTWSRPRLAVGAPDPSGKRQRGALVGNLWTDPRGRLWLFFDQTVIGAKGPTANWWIRCDNPDAAEPVWSKPVSFALGCTLNKPTVLASGEWLLPVSHWAEQTAWVYESTNEGQSWLPRGSVKFPDWEFDEHMLVELRDGRLWMLARTRGQPHETFSDDRGKTWTKPRTAATVQNINARFFLRRLKSGRILLVKNGTPSERLPRRSHLSAFLSDDDGQTWRGGLVLDERHTVSYPDGFEAPDGLIHILYDWNRHTDAEILLAKFREEDILAGVLKSSDGHLKGRVNKATGPKPILYNGIELPAEWPPRRLDPASRAPMPVPWLARPPRVIPIDVGRQLLVDDFLIEQTDLQRIWHRPVKDSENPVFRPERPNETRSPSGVYLGHGGVFFDPQTQVFRLFYEPAMRGGMALATSPNLKNWSRPDLGLPAGGNLVLPPGPKWTGPELRTAGSDNCVWLDLQASRPDERLKFLTCWEHVPPADRPQGFHHSLHVSADGRTWSDGRPTGLAQDYCSFFYNPFRRVWVFSIKQGGPRGRCRYYSENADFLAGADWSRSVYWTNADERDLPEAEGHYPGAGEAPQLYSLNAVAYESLLLGMHFIHRGPNNAICEAGKFPKLVDLEVGFSRDGFHWHRPDRGGFLKGSRAEGAWDRAYLHSPAGVCVVLDDALVFPYCAYSGVNADGSRGMYAGSAVGLARLRRDGFASLNTDAVGTLTTRRVVFSGHHLFVNCQVPDGELRVELLDDQDRVRAMSVPVAGDSTRQRVEWQDHQVLSTFSGRPVRFRFRLTRGSLYSFWVTDQESGASHGYVGAGGPEFTGVRDD